MTCEWPDKRWKYYKSVLKVKLSFQLLTVEIILLTIILYQQYKYLKHFIFFFWESEWSWEKQSNFFLSRVLFSKTAPVRPWRSADTLGTYSGAFRILIRIMTTGVRSSSFTPHPHIWLPTLKQASRSSLVCCKNNLWKTGHHFTRPNTSPSLSTHTENVWHWDGRWLVLKRCVTILEERLEIDTFVFRRTS